MWRPAYRRIREVMYVEVLWLLVSCAGALAGDNFVRALQTSSLTSTSITLAPSRIGYHI